MIDLARARAWLVIGLTCFAVLSPLVPAWRGRNDDSFPLSWYPMFANERPRYEQPVYVIGRNQAGERTKIDVRWWTSGGFNQGRNMLVAMLKGGKVAREEFCERMAKKVAKQEGPRWKAVEEVAIVRGRYDRERFFGAGDREPLSETTIHACAVPR